MPLLKFVQFIQESNQETPPHKKRTQRMPKSEAYWRNIVGSDAYLNGVVDSIFKRQRGFATDRQLQVLTRKETGDTTPYHSKN